MRAPSRVPDPRLGSRTAVWRRGGRRRRRRRGRTAQRARDCGATLAGYQSPAAGALCACPPSGERAAAAECASVARKEQEHRLHALSPHGSLPPGALRCWATALIWAGPGRRLGARPSHPPEAREPGRKLRTAKSVGRRPHFLLAHQLL